MANSPLTKRRKTRNSNDDDDIMVPEPAHEKENCQLTMPMPTEVAEVFISQLTDIRLLKLCRLVCKFWNIEACHGLRKYSYIFLDEDYADFGKHRVLQFRSILEERSFSPFAVTPLPSPFNEIRILVQQFDSENFKNFVLQPFLPIKQLTLNWTSLLDRQSFQKFLQNKMGELEVLKLIIGVMDEGLFFSESVANPHQVRFPSLKCVALQDLCENVNCSHKKFLKNSLQGSLLESVDFEVYSCDALLLLLQMKSLEEVRKMKIRIECGGTEGSWNALAELKFARLTEMHFNIARKKESENYIAQITKFVEGIARSLKILRMESPMFEPPSNSLYFPKLTTIYWEYILSSTTIVQFSPDKFPSLKRISLYFKISNLNTLNKYLSPHDGVKQLHIKISHRVLSQLDTGFPILMMNVAKQFPNIVDISIKLENILGWTRQLLQDIHNVYPKVKSLGMDGSIDFDTLAGSSLENIKKWLENGWDFKDMPRRNYIYDFKELECLTLPKIVTDEFIEYCLSKIPMLRKLSTPWNPEGLTKQGLEIGLQKMKQIHIFAVGPRVAEVYELAEVLPNLYVHEKWMSMEFLE